MLENVGIGLSQCLLTMRVVLRRYEFSINPLKAPSDVTA